MLVVDDDPQLRLLVSHLLRANGYRVTGAGNGNEMHAAMASNAFDLVLLDVMLPGASGFDLCRELRHGLAVPVIMLTARGSEADRVEGLDLGADDYQSQESMPGPCHSSLGHRGVPEDILYLC